MPVAQMKHLLINLETQHMMFHLQEMFSGAVQNCNHYLKIAFVMNPWLPDEFVVIQKKMCREMNQVLCIKFNVICIVCCVHCKRCILVILIVKAVSLQTLELVAWLLN